MRLVLTVIISTISLILAIRVYRVFHRREIQKKQIELVIELIENFQRKEVWIRWIKSEEASSGYTSLFSGDFISIAKNLEKQDLDQFGAKYVYYSEESLQRFNLEKFLYNPILPSLIAKALKKCFPNRTTFSKSSEKNQDLIFIDESRTLDAKELAENYPDEPQEYFGTNGVTLYQLIDGLNDFRNQTSKWFKKQGISKLNIYWTEKTTTNIW
ncbi:MAG: hypothetical protein RIG77_17335 [Cyclobacteriaceae bacterium]